MSTFGIRTSSGGFIMDSGLLNVSVYGSAGTVAIVSPTSILIRGGVVTAFARGTTTYAIYCYLYRQSGGIVAASADGPGDDTTALFFSSSQITGGQGEFSAVETGYGALWASPAAGGFSVSGGQAVFTGGDGALLFITSSDVSPSVVGSVFVSEYPSGTGKTLWNLTMGSLASRTSYTSDYRYVEMNGAAAPSVPQTGDVYDPWLWLSAGLLALGIGAAAFLFLRRKRA